MTRGHAARKALHEAGFQESYADLQRLLSLTDAALYLAYIASLSLDETEELDEADRLLKDAINAVEKAKGHNEEPQLAFNPYTDGVSFGEQ